MTSGPVSSCHGPGFILNVIILTFFSTSLRPAHVSGVDKNARRLVKPFSSFTRSPCVYLIRRVFFACQVLDKVEFLFLEHE
ncbi:hypothetical protein L210DRAFT_3520126 [Boletus edulis BED1]|uniref:Uncharacterized protein n=1 Tax=Boletus edulis BED1 TaxID=1328754 RepID=A0AAD4C6M3_BOLED|nr:hypothetical protein L210DRAFT_3520126 [Boletus edulis BED1]